MRTQKTYQRFLGPILRILVGRCDFTIISNNCWGAHVYQALGIEYRTPFVGLFIPPQSYIALIERFDVAISGTLVFVRESISERLNAWRRAENLTYPIALLDGDIEIHFQHYASEGEALSKWSRRCARISTDSARRFYKFDDREGATPVHIKAFYATAVKQKVCFSATDFRSDALPIPAEKGKNHVPDGVTLARISSRYFNTLRWISTRPSWFPVPPLI